MQRVDGMRNVLVEHEAPDGEVAGTAQITKGDGLRCHLRIEHRTPADFWPVVILRVDPEHRDNRHLMLDFDLPRQLHRGGGLEQREERSSEQARLLTGDHHDGFRIR